MYKILNKTFPSLPKEDTEQKELVQYLKKNGYFFFAINNENNQSFSNRKHAIIIETKARAMGKLKGVPDLCIFLKDTILFIELKRQRPILKSGKLGTPTNKPNKEQLDFIDKSSDYSYCHAVVAYGCDEAIEVIKKLKG